MMRKRNRDLIIGKVFYPSITFRFFKTYVNYRWPKGVAALNLKMYSTTIQDRFFRLIYGSPKRSNMDSGVMIRVHTVCAVVTCKRFAVSIADVLANAARFGRVSGVDRNHRNASTSGLVGDKGSKLVEGPPAHCFTKFLSFVCRPKPDAGQILEGNTFGFSLCNRNDLFSDAVMNDSSRPTFTPAKPFQEFLCSLRAFALNRTAYFLFLFPIIVDFFGVKGFSGADCTNIQQTKVTAHKVLHVFHLFLRHLTGLEQVAFALLKDKIGLSLNVRKILSVVTDVRDFEATGNRPNGGYRTTVGKYPTIIGDASQGSKRSLSLPVQLAGVANLGNAAYNYLSGQMKRGLDQVIAFFVDLELVEYSLFESGLSNGIAGAVGLFKGSQEGVRLDLIRQEFYLQCQLHDHKTGQIFASPKRDSPFLPEPTGVGVSWTKHR
jgi:hypothetical protein